MRSRWSCSIAAVALLVGCSAPEAVEARELSSSHLEQPGAEQTEPTGEEAGFAVGTALTVRLSVNIRSKLLPKAIVADAGPMQAINYGKSPGGLLFIKDGDVSGSASGAGGLRCEMRGMRPAPSMDKKYFPPTLPNPLHMTVTGAGGVSVELETAPDDEDTTWTLACSKEGSGDATLAELRSALGAGSSVTAD